MVYICCQAVYRVGELKLTNLLEAVRLRQLRPLKNVEMSACTTAVVRLWTGTRRLRLDSVVGCTVPGLKGHLVVDKECIVISSLENVVRSYHQLTLNWQTILFSVLSSILSLILTTGL